MIKKYGLILLGSFVGAIVGYLYYHFIGCANGSCLITSNPVNSIIYGLIMGGLLVNMFQPSQTT